MASSTRKRVPVTIAASWNRERAVLGVSDKAFYVTAVQVHRRFPQVWPYFPGGRVVIAAAEKPTTAEDPVCHMAVDPSKASAPIQFEGVHYYFCSEHCKRNFEKDPRKYISVEAKA